MELKRCSRCGAFYSSQAEVCPNCQPKDDYEKSQLQNFLNENEMPASLEALSSYTNISMKNLNRFLDIKKN